MCWFSLRGVAGSGSLDRFVFSFGLVPADFWVDGRLARWPPLFTSMFLHGSWLHLIFNMLALYIFGDTSKTGWGTCATWSFICWAGCWPD